MLKYLCMKASNKLILNMLALCFIYIAAWLDWSWVWGVLFLVWIFPAFYTGEVHLVGVVKKVENPILFWAILGTWVLMSLYLIIMNFIPAFETT